MKVRAPRPGALRLGPPALFSLGPGHHRACGRAPGGLLGRPAPVVRASESCARSPRGLRGVWRSQRLLSTPVQELTPADAGGGVDRAPQDGRQDTRAGPDDVGPSCDTHLKSAKRNQRDR